jgi:hypothetical protein
MKKLLTLLFTAAIVFSLTMPVFAQDTRPQKAPKAEKKTHVAKAAKTKKAKSAKTKLKKT